jgi:hypothetical protein
MAELPPSYEISKPSSSSTISMIPSFSTPAPGRRVMCFHGSLLCTGRDGDILRRFLGEFSSCSSVGAAPVESAWRDNILDFRLRKMPVGTRALTSIGSIVVRRLERDLENFLMIVTCLGVLGVAKPLSSFNSQRSESNTNHEHSSMVSKTGWNPVTETPDLTGKVAVVTGGK